MHNQPWTQEWRAQQNMIREDRQRNRKYERKQYNDTSRQISPAQRQRMARQFEEKYPILHATLDCCCDCCCNFLVFGIPWIFCFPCKFYDYLRKRSQQNLKEYRKKKIQEIQQVLKQPNLSARERHLLETTHRAAHNQFENSQYFGRFVDNRNYFQIPQVKTILDTHRKKATENPK